MGIWGSYYNIPQAIFYLLKGDYRVQVSDVTGLHQIGIRPVAAVRRTGPVVIQEEGAEPEVLPVQTEGPC